MKGIPLVAAALRYGIGKSCLFGRRRRHAADAFVLETKVASALAANPLLATLGLTTRTRVLRGRARPMVELRGQVPTAEAYREVLKILSDHAWGMRPGVGVIDRIVLAPPRRT